MSVLLSGLAHFNIEQPKTCGSHVAANFLDKKMMIETLQKTNNTKTVIFHTVYSVY